VVYKKYTVKKVKEDLGLRLQQKRLFENIIIQPLQGGQLLTLALATAEKMAITTEKAVCEYLVSPILYSIKSGFKM
jgi:hypothetical protein